MFEVWIKPTPSVQQLDYHQDGVHKKTQTLNGRDLPLFIRYITQNLYENNQDKFKLILGE